MDELVLLAGVGGVGLAVCWRRLAQSESSEPSSGGGLPLASPQALAGLRRRYLLGFIPAMLADWIMGAHIYALYRSHGYSMHQIALLFTVGFGASLSLGTVISAAADRFGRRRGCLCYCGLYAVSAVANTSSWAPMLCLARVLGGAGTSLLYSSYEAWLVDEHSRLGLSLQSLGPLFSQCTFFNAVAAIAGGMIAEFAVLAGGLTAPFYVATLPLICSAVAVQRWQENFGGDPASKTPPISLLDGVRQIVRSPLLLGVGLLSAVFEACMFVFIFLWTPSLESRAPTELRYGLVFAVFMLWKMLGSCLYQLSHQLLEQRGSLVAAGVPLGLAAGSLVVPVVCRGFGPVLAACMVFEGCVGWYWPMIGELRAERVPETARATIMSLFRVPLNLMVLFCMSHMGQWDEATAYMICVQALLVAMVGFVATERIASKKLVRKSDDEPLQQLLTKQLSPLVKQSRGSSSPTFPRAVHRDDTDRIMDRIL